MKKMVLYIIFCFFCFTLKSQVLFYQDLCHCGVTGAGFSVGNGAGNGSFDVYIEPGSTIKKAWLFSYRSDNAIATDFLMNGMYYNFNPSNQVTPDFYSSFPNIVFPNAVHAIDVTNDINPDTINYNVTIFYPPDPLIKYKTVYLWIEYEKPTLPLTNSVILLNNYDLTTINTNYNTTNLTPINSNYPVGFAVYTDILNDTILQDGSYVFFNTNLLGLIGCSDYNSTAWTWAGVKGHFYYQNNTLFGLGDDTPDSLMVGPDGLADVSSYLNNNDTSFNFRLQWQHTTTSNAHNYYLGFFASYTPATTCDTFSTAASTSQDTVCEGEPVQLNATGGVQYNWHSAFSTFNDSTLANPVATPTQTTTYIVTIKNDSGCVKTEHVKVWVNPAPKPDTIIITPQRCGSTNGSITVGNIPKGTPPFTYSLTNLQTLNTTNQATTTFNNLTAGNYLITITDSNGCQWTSDTLIVNEIHDITANFTLYTLPLVFPTPNPLGEAPLTVYSHNHSTNANSFEWTVISNQELGVSDTIEQIPASAGMTTPNFNFENGGTYQICLFAYNNIPACGDSICKTIVVAPAPDSLVLVVPNVFTPNNDGSNDNFVLQIQSVNLLESVSVEIFNRWGQPIKNQKWGVESLQSSANNSQQLTLWDGTTTTGTKTPDGTYYYIISYTKLSGETETLKGYMNLWR